MTIEIARMLGMRGDGIERAVGADILRLVDIELHRPASSPCPATNGVFLKYFCDRTSRLWSARGTTVPMITPSTCRG